MKKFKLTIGCKTKAQLLKELKKINISDYAMDMIKKIDFQKEKEVLELVKISVRELGFDDWTTVEQIYKEAKKRGYELCPPEVGIYQRLKETKQTLDDWYLIGMKTIADRYGSPSVFDLNRDAEGLRLYSYWADPDYEWGPDYEFVFRVKRIADKPLDTLSLEISEIKINNKVYRRIDNA